LDDVDSSEIDKGSYFLDIGCRNIEVLSKLYSMGFRNVFGMDIGKKCCRTLDKLTFY